MAAAVNTVLEVIKLLVKQHNNTVVEVECYNLKCKKFKMHLPLKMNEESSVMHLLHVTKMIIHLEQCCIVEAVLQSRL